VPILFGPTGLETGGLELVEAATDRREYAGSLDSIAFEPQPHITLNHG
jgi:hypothetical protein